MEQTIDMKGLDRPCICGKDKIAGLCCRKGEPCPCSSDKTFDTCCAKRYAKEGAE